MALSADGNTALIGGDGDNGSVGAAWVFTRSGSTWTQQGAKLTGSGESGAGCFGYSVALSADGNTALIGGYAATTATVGRGVGVHALGLDLDPAGRKAHRRRRERSRPASAGSVALSADGNTALIGGPATTASVGAAWVFTRSGSTWTQQGEKLTGSGEIGAGRLRLQRRAVRRRQHGADRRPRDNSGVGAAWVFTRSGVDWTQQGEKLTGSGESGEAEFGCSVALSSDGDTALIGGSDDNNGVGAAWVFANRPRRRPS